MTSLAHAVSRPQACVEPAGGGQPDHPVLWHEVLVGLAVFGVYAAVTTLGGKARHATADAHSRDLFHLEQAAHLDIERPLNTWLGHHDGLMVMANYEYAFTYILSAFLLLGWLYVRQPDVYRWARTSFVILNLLAITCFALYPVTPPRLLPSLGFIDTVTRGHTFGSWGSGAVDHANAIAAMPSLHLGWALWVSVVLGYIAGSLRVQLLSLGHVTVTLFVIMATANHYLLDAVGGTICVMAGIALARIFSRPPSRGPKGTRVAAADVFFLYVESAHSPQQVGGLLILDSAEDRGAAPTRDQLETVVRSQLHRLPRFTQRLGPISRWRRPRWLTVTDLDWAWHVTSHDLRTEADGPAGVEALKAYVAELEATPLPRDRPLWRLVAVPGVTPDSSAVVLVVHHAIADGLGTVQHALALLEPAVTKTATANGDIGRVRRLSATAVGLAQLARDGRPTWRAAEVEAPGRSFGTVSLSLDEVRRVARRLEAKVTDLILCLVAGAVSRVLNGDEPGGNQLRVSLTLMVPRAGTEGNATGAAMVDVPLGAQDETARLDEIARRSRRLRSGSRAIASRFVMDSVGELMPPLAHAWFARTVYGRRYFHAIVSNMPGPEVQLTLAGHRLARVFPILPLAPGSPIAVGALSVTGHLGLGISAHPLFIPDMAAFESAVADVYDDLRLAASTDPSPRRRNGPRDPSPGCDPAAPGSVVPGQGEHQPEPDVRVVKT